MKFKVGDHVVAVGYLDGGEWSSVHARARGVVTAVSDTAYSCSTRPIYLVQFNDHAFLACVEGDLEVPVDPEPEFQPGLFRRAGLPDGFNGYEVKYFDLAPSCGWVRI